MGCGRISGITDVDGKSLSAFVLKCHTDASALSTMPLDAVARVRVMKNYSSSVFLLIFTYACLSVCVAASLSDCLTV